MVRLSLVYYREMIHEIQGLLSEFCELYQDGNTIEGSRIDGPNQGWIIRIVVQDDRIAFCHLKVIDKKHREIGFFFTRSKRCQAFDLMRTMFASWQKDCPKHFYDSWLQAIPTTIIHPFDDLEAQAYREIIEEIVDRDEQSQVFEYLSNCILATSLKYDLRIETYRSMMVLFSQNDGPIYPGISIKLDVYDNGITTRSFVCAFEDKVIVTKASIPGFFTIIDSMIKAQLFSMWLEATIISMNFWLSHDIQSPNELFTLSKKSIEDGSWMSEDAMAAQSLFYEIESYVCPRK